MSQPERSHFSPNALKQGYKEDDGLELQSDSDEQLLVYIPFTQVVKLHSLLVKAPEDDGPKTVKLYSNKEHVSFSNVSDYPPSDMVALSSERLKGKPSVVNLTNFIDDNQSGSEIT